MSELKSQLMKARESNLDLREAQNELDEYWNFAIQKGHAKDQRLFELLIDVAVVADKYARAGGYIYAAELNNALAALKSFVAGENEG